MPALRYLLLASALCFSLTTQAQTTYHWVDKATGKTVYSDLPPPSSATQVSTKASNATRDDSQLPYAIRLAAEKYPVTLYTAANCTDPCKQGRELLNGRGVPFTEQMLNTDEDVAALSKRLGADVTVPSLFVGTQSFRGFEAMSWNNLLDLAGYPASAPYGAKPSGAFAK